MTVIENKKPPPKGDTVQTMAEVTKPYWVAHSQSPIHSVAVHPDGTRLATCGDDRRVRIWAMDPILKQDSELDGRQPKKLCELTNHTRGVNCIRWSPNGQYLASAGADNHILIFQKTETQSGFNESGNVESWECIFTRAEHQSDVEDIAWSPDSKYLASCSLDSTIAIWRQKDEGEFEKHRTLKGHKNWVKGLAWDPLNKYLASQGAEGCLTLWRTSDWEAETQIQEHFFDTTNLTFDNDAEQNVEVVFFRPSWSPDGNYLVGSFGKIDDVYVSPVFKRGTWVKEACYVGHRKPTTISTFNPKGFQTKDGKDFVVCAVGSMDNSVSFWTSSGRRPKLVIEHLFHSSILDLSWAPDGKSCVVASSDGSVACIGFDEGFFGGKPLTDAELAKKIQSMHGDLLNNSELWENPDNALKISKSKASVAPKPKPRIQVAPTEQQEFRNQKGRRVIIPEVLVDDSPRKLPSVSTPSVFDQVMKPKPSTGTSAAQRVKKVNSVMASRLGTGAVETGFAPSSKSNTPASPVIDLQPRRPKNNEAKPKRNINNVRNIVPNKRRASDMVEFCLQENPAKRKRISEECVAEGDQKYRVEMKTATRKLGITQETICKITCSLKEDEIHWSSEIFGDITCMQLNKKILAIGTHSGSLHLLSTDSGRLLMGRHLQISSKPIVQTAVDEEGRVLVVANDGKFVVWEIDYYRPWNSKLVYRADLRDIVCASAFSDAWFQDGQALIQLKGQEVYSFNPNLEAWVCLSDSAFWGSKVRSKFPQTLPNIVALRRLNDNEKQCHTMNHLEGELFNADLLSNPEEYKNRARQYVSTLLEKPVQVARLKEFCDSLLQGDASESDVPSVRDCIWRRKLLQDIIPLLGRHKELERTVKDYNEQIKAKEMEKDEDILM